MTINNVEEWREVVGYEGLYKISRMKYKYSRVEMVSLFVNGARNVDIAKQLGIPRQLVNTYKYKWRKGEKLC